MLNVAVKQKRLASNPCNSVEFPIPINHTIRNLRHTFATRLSAGGVSDHFVTLMLRQGDAQVFKRYSQATLNMKRKALTRLDRSANEHAAGFATAKPN